MDGIALATSVLAILIASFLLSILKSKRLWKNMTDIEQKELPDKVQTRRIMKIRLFCLKRRVE